MILKPFDKLPESLRCDEVRRYYDILSRKKAALCFKRILDLLLSVIGTVVLIIPICVIAVIVKSTSEGPVFFRQERVTTYGRHFRIFKFRTMTVNAEQQGSQITCAGDSRVTGVGKTLRKYRLDELPQIFNVLKGDMSFVGTRPEVPRFVDRYTPEMRATLLMPAGITSLASIKYKDEDRIIGKAENPEDVDRIYVEEVLPGKMRYNLKYIRTFSAASDIILMLSTVKNMIF